MEIMSNKFLLSSIAAVSASAKLAHIRANQEPNQDSYNAAWLHGYADALTKAAGKIAELRAAGYSVKKPPLVHALPQYADCHYFEHEPHYSACRAFDDYCLISADMPALSRMKLIRMLKTACAAQHN